MMLLQLLLTSALGPFAADWQQPVALPDAAEPPQCARIQEAGGKSLPRFAIRPAAVELTGASLDPARNAHSCSRELPVLDTSRRDGFASLSIELDLSALSSRSSSGKGAPSISTRLDEPADTTGYELLTREGCSEVRTPLDSITPAAVPGAALAIVPAGRADAIASRSGARLLRGIALDSIDLSLIHI